MIKFKNITLLLLTTPFVFLFINCKTEIPIVNNAKSSSLSGVIKDYDDLATVPEASIKLNDLTEVSDKKGFYEFKGIIPGVYNLTVSKTGYLTITLKINITGKIKKDFLLKTLPGIIHPDIVPTPFTRVSATIGSPAPTLEPDVKISDLPVMPTIIPTIIPSPAEK